MHNTQPAHRSARLLTALASCAAFVLVLAGCGAEEAGPSAVESPAGAAVAPAAPAAPAQGTADTAPTDAFCSAYADFLAAEDGAQRNTAIGGMEAAIPDPSGEVGQALDTLQTGDLDPSEYTAAEAVLAGYAADCSTTPAPQQPTG
jgi:hypothetical protein